MHWRHTAATISLHSPQVPVSHPRREPDPSAVRPAGRVGGETPARRPVGGETPARRPAGQPAAPRESDERAANAECGGPAAHRCRRTTGRRPWARGWPSERKRHDAAPTRFWRARFPGGSSLGAAASGRDKRPPCLARPDTFVPGGVQNRACRGFYLPARK